MPVKTKSVDDSNARRACDPHSVRLGGADGSPHPSTTEWGVMISGGRNYIATHTWLLLFPGLAILFTVAAFNLIGAGLRDALDPRLRGTG